MYRMTDSGPWGSYRTAILAALGELHYVRGAGIVNFTLFGCREGLYEEIVQQT